METSRMVLRSKGKEGVSLTRQDRSLDSLSSRGIMLAQSSEQLIPG